MLLTEEKIYSVSELNHIVNTQLSVMLLKVRGEISDFRKSGNFVYFDLKDEGSRINCFVMAFQLRQEIEDGMAVVVTGSPGVYVPYGKYTFRVKMIEPVGEGALQRAFVLTRKKLEEEGLFSEEHKKPLPRFPACIGLITSREAAAYSDFLRILHNRWRGVEVLFRDVRVQGDGAAEEIVAAMQIFNMYTPVPDVLLLTRGGGSLEDLQAFNNENVVRAIFASKIPVVVGVGHERDTTLADLVADVRASTPSNAAERLVPNRADILYELETFSQTFKLAMMRLLRNASERVNFSLDRMEYLLHGNLEKGRMLAQQLETVFGARIKFFGSKLLHSSALLKTLNPRDILQRGYSITRKNGKILKDASVLNAGDIVETFLLNGKFESAVK